MEARQQEVSDSLRALKLTAKELNVPVIFLSQLDLGAERRADDAEDRGVRFPRRAFTIL